MNIDLSNALFVFLILAFFVSSFLYRQWNIHLTDRINRLNKRIEHIERSENVKEDND